MDKEKKAQIAKDFLEEGLRFFMEGKPELAFNTLLEIFAFFPEDPYVYFHLGIISESQNRNEDALKYYLLSIRNGFRNPEVFFRAGMLSIKMGNISPFQQLLEEEHFKDPANILYLSVLAEISMNTGQYQNSINYYKKLSLLKPNEAIYFNGLALNYYHLVKSFKRDFSNIEEFRNFFTESEDLLKSAIEAIKKAIALYPFNSSFLNNFGIISCFIGEYETALKNYTQAIGLNPQNYHYYNNRATVFEELGKYSDAFQDNLKVLNLVPNDPETLKKLSFLKLKTGEIKEGFKLFDESSKMLYERREFIEFYKKTEWNGEQLCGKTIYVISEYGFGDIIQFSRYLSKISEKAGRVIFNCKPELRELMKTIKGIDVISSNELLKEGLHFDTFTYLMKLPCIFETTLDTIPAEIPYLSVPKENKTKFENYFENIKGFKIGFVWKTAYDKDSFLKRSCSFKYFYDFAEKFQDISFFSLQKGIFSGEFKELPLLKNMIDLSCEINDFADTAAIINNLDLVISVDTSVVHLAGALGKKVWSLLPFSADWIWLLERDSSPWYPTLKLFRQDIRGNWDFVFQNVENELIGIREQTCNS